MLSISLMSRRLRVLSIRDNSADAGLIQEFWGSDPQVDLIAHDSGQKVLDLLGGNSPRPNLILLASTYAANQPTALQIITALKADPEWRLIPIIVLTDSVSPADSRDWYTAGISCVVTLPSDLDEFEENLAAIKNFWMKVAIPPP